MSKSVELREQRKRAVDEDRRILDAVLAAGGEWTSEQREKHEKLDATINDLKRTIDALERLEAEERGYVPPSQAVPPAPVSAEDRAAQYRDAFWRAMRAGIGPDERRVMAVGTDTSGGYTVPDEFRRELIAKLDELNVIRQRATVIPTTSGTLTIPVLTTHGSASWVAENGSYSETTPTFDEKTFSPHKLSVLLKVSEELMNDSAFPLERFVAGEFGRAIAEAEETAFVTGTGSNQPTGLIASSNGSALGKTATATNAITAAELVDLYHALPRPYRQSATWVMNDSTISAVRQLVTGVSGDKTFLWQPGLAAGEPDMLLGRPVVPCADMPAIASGAKAVVFGDLRYFYIVERPGMAMQRLVELYSANGHIGFRMFVRRDSKVVLDDAIKHLKLA